MSFTKENIKRILDNDLVLLMSKSNEGKTMVICDLITSYKEHFKGSISVYGLKEQLVKGLKVNSFHSLIELEALKSSLIFIDEVGLLMDLSNRQKKKQVENILRLVNHNGNKLILGGLPMDFKRFLCSKAKVFLFKSLYISDLINGSLAKEVIKQFDGEEKGMFSFNIAIDKVLCYDGKYWREKITYYRKFDTKLENCNLFRSEKRKKTVKNSVSKGDIK